LKIYYELPPKAEVDEYVAIDIEMFGQTKARLHRPHGTFACISISFGRGRTYQIRDQSDLAPALHRIQRGRWITHNGLYDIRQLRRFVTIEQRPIHDTFLVEKTLFGGWYLGFALGDLSRRWLGVPLSKEARSGFSKRTEMTNEMAQYAARDALATYQIAMAQIHYIADEDVDMRHYWTVDEPATWAVMDMPGVRINVDGWLALAEQNETYATQMEEALGINTMSPKQVKDAIQTEIGETIPNTNASETLRPLLTTLERRGSSRPATLVRNILEAKRFRKLASTYGTKWIDTHVEEGDLVFPDWKVIGTETGRMACSSPNLQQIPKRTEGAFRELFIRRNPKGRVITADIWNQEVCVLASLSGDENLWADLEEGTDIHAATAEDFRVDDRDIGKRINLGLNYGMSAYGVVELTGLSESEVKRGMRAREARWPGVPLWQRKQRSMADRFEYVQTAMGRRIWMNLYGDQWERNASNAPVQGSAADQTKRWLVLLHQAARANDIPFDVVLVVHDEIVVDTDRSGIWRRLLTQTGAKSGTDVGITFPMNVEMEAGPTWGG